MSESQTTDTVTRNLLDKTLKSIETLDEITKDLITEKRATKLLLEHLKLRIKEAERKYGDLMDHIVQTRQSRERMGVIAQNLRCLLSPMKNLPIEILVRIFRMTIDEADTHRRSYLEAGIVLTPVRVPLVLSQVCSYWRVIVSKNSSLWNFLQFRDKRDDGTVETVAEILRFRRFAVSGVPGKQDIIVPQWDLPRHDFLLKTLPSMTSPCRSLEIHVNENPTGQWDVRKLTAREVTICCENDVPDIDFLVPLLRLASKITIHGSPPRWAGLPWMALTELLLKPFIDGDYLDLQRADFCGLLDATPSLNTLKLDFRIEGENMDTDANAVSRTHLSLQHLELHFQHLSRQGLFGVQMELPNLSTLRLLSFDSHSSENEDFMFGSWSPKRLVLPKLRKHEVTSAAKLLSQLPHIKHLEISGSNSDTIIKYIQAGYVQSRTSSTKLFKPKLTTLHLTGTDVKGDTLLNLVQERLRRKRMDGEGVYALEIISMYETPGVSPRDWWVIQGLLKEGRAENGSE